MPNYLARLRAITSHFTVGRQLATVEVAALRRLASSRRMASMTMRQRRDTSLPTGPGGSPFETPPPARNP
jgi:hypothetical protein